MNKFPKNIIKIDNYFVEFELKTYFIYSINNNYTSTENCEFIDCESLINNIYYNDIRKKKSQNKNFKKLTIYNKYNQIKYMQKNHSIVKIKKL